MKKMNVSRGFPALWAGIASMALLFAGCASEVGPDPDPAPGLMPGGGYTVTFDPNGGDAEAGPQTKTVTAPATSVGSLPAAPTYAGHAFSGWNTAADGGGEDFTADTKVSESLTVYAQWTMAAAGPFTVTFDSNYENPEAVPQTVVVTAPATTVGTLPAAPTREGYAFNGWNTDREGGGKDFTASTPVNDDFTVYAQWQEITPDSFTVTFDSNGGTTEASPPTKIVNPPLDTVDALPTTQPTRAGYAFNGWNTDREGEGTAFTAGTTVSESLTVYAQWLYVYTVTFDSNGGTTEASPRTKTVTEPATTVNALPAQPTRAGYAFKGWYTAATGGSAFTADTKVSESLTVYAQWLYVYTVTFDKNGGTTEANPKTKTVTEPATTVGTLPTQPTRAGFTFSGWYTAATGGTVFTASTTVTASRTVYAQWKNNALVALEEQLAATGGSNASSPLAVTVSMELSAANWNSILSAISAANKYVALNLAACVKSTHSSGGGLYTTGAFDPNYAVSTGKDRIVSLVLPDAAASIAAGTDYNKAAFKGFTSLKSVSGEQVTDIGDYAFSECTSLTSVSFPVATTIGIRAFEYCTSFTNVSFPAATTIGIRAFDYCTSLTDVSFPVATTIDYGAFTDCKLINASFPKVASIDDIAFRNCKSLISVSFPAAASIGENTFGGCTKLTSFTLTGTGALSAIEGGKALVRNNTELVAYPSATGSITLSAITSIGIRVFYDCSGLTNVSLQKATNIGYQAFYGCSGLTSVSFPAAANIGDQAFAYCSGLTSVSLPKTTNIGAATFGGCTKLTSFTLSGTGVLSVIESGKALVRNNTELVTYPSAAGSITLSAITSIGDGAFAGCFSLTSVSLPVATSIGAGAFALTGTAALSITLGGSKAPTVGEDMFLYLAVAKTVTVRYPVGASGYGTAPTDTSTQNWGNAFRGIGWNGSKYLTGAVNDRITLKYQTYTP